MSTEKNLPDYSDIQKLENLVWSDSSRLDSYRAYSTLYHQLATEHGEEILLFLIEQYNSGGKW